LPGGEYGVYDLHQNLFIFFLEFSWLSSEIAFIICRWSQPIAQKVV